MCGWDSAPAPEHAEDWLVATRAWGDAWLLGPHSRLPEPAPPKRVRPGKSPFSRCLSQRTGKTYTLPSADDVASP